MTRPLVAAVQLPEAAARAWLGGTANLDMRITGADLSALPDDVECLMVAPQSYGGPLVRPSSWPGPIRWVQLLSTGLDGYPDWLFDGVTVTTMHGVNAVAVAEFAMGAILAEARRIPAVWEEGQAWPEGGGPGPISAGMAGARLGIVGFGAIGAAIAHRALAFGMEVQAIRASTAPLPEPVHRAASLDDLFATSDHVVLALPSTASTVGLVDAALLGKAKRGFHLVNIARGDLVDEDALREALDSGIVGRATLDVLRQEPPPPDHPLLGHARVRISPHVSAHTPGAIDGMAARVRRNIDAYRSGRPLEGVLKEWTG